MFICQKRVSFKNKFVHVIVNGEDCYLPESLLPAELIEDSWSIPTIEIDCVFDVVAVLEYLIRRGFTTTVQTVINEYGIDGLIDFEKVYYYFGLDASIPFIESHEESCEKLLVGYIEKTKFSFYDSFFSGVVLRVVGYANVKKFTKNFIKKNSDELGTLSEVLFWFLVDENVEKLAIASRLCPVTNIKHKLAELKNKIDGLVGIFGVYWYVKTELMNFEGNPEDSFLEIKLFTHVTHVDNLKKNVYYVRNPEWEGNSLYFDVPNVVYRILCDMLVENIPN